MIDLSAKQKIYILGSGFALVFILIVFLIIWPLVDRITIQGEELAQKQAAIENFYQGWMNLGALKKDYQKIQADLNENSFLLPAKNPINFVEMIESFAQQTKNQEQITALPGDPGQPAAPDAPKNKDLLFFQVSTGGSFPSLIKFLVSLENAPYYTNVSSMQITRSSAKETTKEEYNLSPGDVRSIINLSVNQQ